MILEVQVQNFDVCTRWRTPVKVFIFKKIPGGQNINIFCENWHETSFYIKEQTQKNVKFYF